ncbi:MULTISPECIES: GntR family transcriptional regulator [unclassified Streptomyces]|uniref:GntR family transcriptional regulator n=1 Tax=unclassified Streptomyces TaxID=2593676 RepID=UPI002DDB2BAF|nr:MULTISPECIES: GntR family transcriptional regulator [unclassified Streptomyces]WSS46845.1 GntR family transcriptional regulator [Streptomyces sp. NBC_01187]WSA97637.1 GntR family transcriptional regulator [Streptomyces sp. NBC_01795]WSB82113.1 GntR family transcriptional regulator [Streptomyces sp. NBC_01775]WSS18084.1 GntR family transcriptional regulator [Streptomyces sp. NBC_01186]WSS46938.1 GntR family transcriptional regulator [Streptomyces sp. NBC_01187]
MEPIGALPSNALSSAHAVYLALRRSFANGEFAPSERLTEAALARELGVSRTPVREALGRLQADGLVVPMARGVAVATLSRAEVEQIYELRAALEGLAAAQTARLQTDGRIAPAEIRAIENAAGEVERAVAESDPKHSAQANLAFHRCFGQAPGNAFLTDALHRVWDRIAVSTVSNLSDSEWAQTVLDQHRDICRAIVAGDEEAARRAAENHVLSAMRVYSAAHSQ